MNIVTIPEPYDEHRNLGICPTCAKTTLTTSMFFPSGLIRIDAETEELRLLGAMASCPCGYSKSFDKYGVPASIVRTAHPEKIIVDDPEAPPLGS